MTVDTLLPRSPNEEASGNTGRCLEPAECSALRGPPPAKAADNTYALQSMFNALKAGDTLTLDAAATYEYSNVLTIRVAGVRINGNGATLRATNPSLAALQILADNVIVSDLNLTGLVEPPAGRPQSIQVGFRQHRHGHQRCEHHRWRIGGNLCRRCT